jgi:hypothetical protein
MTLENRQRKHEQTHQRTLEQQILDALLRIEELLQKPEETSVEGNIEDVIVNVKPQETPFQKAVAKKPTGARKVDRL